MSTAHLAGYSISYEVGIEERPVSVLTPTRRGCFPYSSGRL
jgi:hypothetical protein